MIVLNTPKQMRRWYASATKGKRAVYHFGYLAVDRQRLRTLEDGTTEWIAHQPVAALADAAWSLYEAGGVTLVQERIEPGTYVYMIERR